VTGNERCLVTQLQVRACVFRSNYGFHLIAEAFLVCDNSINTGQ